MNSANYVDNNKKMKRNYIFLFSFILFAWSIQLSAQAWVKSPSMPYRMGKPEWKYAEEKSDNIEIITMSLKGPVKMVERITKDKKETVLVNRKGQITETKIAYKWGNTIYKYQYNKKSKVVLVDQYAGKDKEMELIFRTKYTYDKRGNRIAIKSQKGKGKYGNADRYVYDAKNRIIRYHWNKIPIRTYRYKYNRAGYLVEHSTYHTPRRGRATFTGKFLYKYNSKNQFVEFREYNGSRRLVKLMRYKWDDRGNLIEERTYRGRQVLERIQYSWTNKRQIKLQTYYLGRNLHRKNEYKYDEHGNIVFHKYWQKYKPGFEKGPLTGQVTYKNIYDSYDNLAKVIIKGKENDSKVISKVKELKIIYYKK
ncbi:hypothetical protein ACFL20_05405 [Spirochaetota bacterium]